MKILIVGNGFDLAHELPTRYSDFLKFIKIFDLATRGTYLGTSNELQREHLDDWNVDTVIKDYIITAFNKKFRTDTQNELIKLINNNFWIKYFEKNQYYINENWIDFESEISMFIQKIELNINNIRKRGGRRIPEQIYKFLDSKISEDLYLFVENYYDGPSKTDYQEEELRFDLECSIDACKEQLKVDLLKLIRCLEIYLCDCVEKIRIKQKSPDIAEMKFDKILSFNYTDTYKRIYNINLKDKDCDYIHGKAVLNNLLATNNMVLGIDDYLSGDEVNQNTEFIYFKKYFQRLVKHTDNQYKGWIQDINDNVEYGEVFIFGHSLDITDKDVLRKLIRSENVKTTIFYKDQPMLEQQVANLVKLIDRDELLRYTGGLEKQLKFVKQSDFVKI